MLPNASENDSLTDSLPETECDATSTSFSSISRNLLRDSPAVTPCSRAEARCLPFNARRKSSGLCEPWFVEKLTCWTAGFAGDHPRSVSEEEFEAPREKARVSIHLMCLSSALSPGIWSRRRNKHIKWIDTLAFSLGA